MNRGTPTAHERERCLFEAADWLLRISEGELPESELWAWMAWCEADVENVRAFDQLQKLWSAAADKPSPVLMARLLGPERPAESLNEIVSPTPRSRISCGRSEALLARASRWGALAAAVVITGGVGALIIRSPWTYQGPMAGRSAVAPAPLAKELNRTTILSDGSQVELGAQSTVDVNFSQRHRQLLLRGGEAYFRVKHDSTRPFVVTAGGLKVLAVGTAFDIRRDRTDVVVTVQEGIVDIFESTQLDPDATPNPTGPRTAADRNAVRAQAGEQIIFNAISGQMRRVLVDPNVALAWRSGRMEFIGDSLDTVIEAVNRYAVVPIVIDDPALGNLQFTGTVFLDSIDGWIDSLPKVFTVVVDRSDKNRITLRRRTA